MPRITKSQVEFECDGLTFVADFRHQHVRRLPVKRTFKTSPNTLVTMISMVEDPKGLPNMLHSIGPRIFPQKIRHITRCSIFLRGKEESIWGEGKAKCSMSDRYDWRIGVDLAFRRALDDSIPDMPAKKNEMIRAFYFHMALRAEPLDTVAAGMQMVHVPPVAQPGRTLPRLTGTATAPFEVPPPMIHGFGIVKRNGVNLMLPMARLNEIDPKALPSNGDDFVEGVLVHGEDIPAGGA